MAAVNPLMAPLRLRREVPDAIAEEGYDALGFNLPSAGLIQDLRQRGLLEDTLVVWGGEFGRKSVLPG